MNAENIINQISKEKERYLAQFNEKKRFNQETKDYFKFLHINDRSTVSLLCFTSTIILSIIFGFVLDHFFSDMKNIFHGFFIFTLATFSGWFLFKTISKIISRIVFNKLYKNRNHNNIIKNLFQRYFYKTNISNEIHNILKVYLSDDSYVHLVKKGITYKNAYNILNEIVKKEKIIANKREVFLTL